LCWIIAARPTFVGGIEINALRIGRVLRAEMSVAGRSARSITKTFAEILVLSSHHCPLSLIGWVKASQARIAEW
jgi:hypothetical protein